MLEFDNYFLIIYVFMSLVAFMVIALKPNNKTNKVLIVIFGIIWLFLFGFRHFDVGSDTRAYLFSYDAYLSSDGTFSIEQYKDFGYFLYMVLVSQISTSERLFVFLFDFLYLVPLMILFIKIKTQHIFLLFFCFCSFFFFKSMGINVVRQGISLSFFLLGLFSFFENKKKKAYLFYFIGYLFHSSLLIAVLTFFLSERIKNIKLPLLIYFSALVLSSVGLDFSLIITKIPIINVFFEERLQAYFDYDETEYIVGFRLSFVIFNTIFALIGLYFSKKKISDSIPYYDKILYSYLILSAVFFLMFNLAFSDRTGILSWVLIPFLLMPIITMNKSGVNMWKLYFLSILMFVFFNV